MAKLYQWPGAGADLERIEGQLGTLTRRLGDLEHKVSQLAELVSRRSLGDRTTRLYHSGEFSERTYGRASALEASPAAPWISNMVRFQERLTSAEYVRATAGQAALMGITFAGLGAGAALFFGLPWFASPVIGAAGAALSAGVLVIVNRLELHRLITGQAEGARRRRQELRIQIDKAEAGGRVAGIEFLYVADITKEQLAEFAPLALRGDSLSVNVIGGGGKIFTQPQAQALGAELELLGYATAARGNQGRRLTAKGRALFKGIAALPSGPMG